MRRRATLFVRVFPVLLLGGFLAFVSPDKVSADDRHQKLEKRELKEHQRMERELYGRDAVREHQRMEKRELQRHQRAEREFYRGYRYGYGNDPRVYGYSPNPYYRAYPPAGGYNVYPNRQNRRYRIYLWP